MNPNQQKQRFKHHLRRMDALFKEIGSHARWACEYLEVDGEQVEVPSREELKELYEPGQYFDRAGNLVTNVEEKQDD